MKDVAKALGDLISATKAAAGKVGDDPAVWQLKNSAKVGGNESSLRRGSRSMCFLLFLKRPFSPIPLTLVGDGDQCDIVAQDCESCRRRGYQRHAGPGSNHRTHTAGTSGEHESGASGSPVRGIMLD